jgi:hypothetical protein
MMIICVPTVEGSVIIASVGRAGRSLERTCRRAGSWPCIRVVAMSWGVPSRFGGLSNERLVNADVGGQG